MAKPRFGWDAAGLLALYCVAFLLRMSLADVPFWIDETAVYHTARTGGDPLPNVYNEEHATPAENIHTRWLFYQRPLHSMLLAPGAWISPEVYRIWYILLASLLAPVTVAFLRAMDVRAPFAYPAGLAIAVLPAYVIFGVYTFPDSLMLLALVGAQLANHKGRPYLASALALAAILIKEFAYVFVFAWFVLDIWRTRATLFDGRWLRLSGLQAGLGLVLLVGLWPLLMAMAHGGAFPGWFRGGTLQGVADRSFIVPWLAVPVVVGLFMKRSRQLSLLGLVYPAFFFVYQASGRGVAMSYFLASGVMVLVAGAVAADAAWDRFSTVASRVAQAVFSSWLLLCVTVAAAAPAATPLKDITSTPLSRDSDPSLLEWKDFVRRQDEPRWRAYQFIDQPQWQSVLFVDPQWHDPFYPLAQNHATVRLAYTGYADQFTGYLARLVHVLENMTDVTFLAKTSSAASQAILSVYSDCIRFDNEQAAVIEGPACKGRGADVQSVYAAIRAGTHRP